MKGQVIADFIVDHSVKDEENIDYVSVCPWKLYFDGSVCREGQGVGTVLISTNNVIYETSVRLEYNCTNNQAEYEALLFGLQCLADMGVKDIDAFGDSLLVVQQFKGEFQCFDGLLNSYLDRCLDIIKTLDTFTISHIPREENSRANYLAQQASGYNVNRGKFLILEKPMHVAARDEIELQLIRDTHRVTDGKFENAPSCTELYRVAANSETKVDQVTPSLEDLVQGMHMPELPQTTELPSNSETVVVDWRVPLINHLRDPSKTRDRKVRRQALKYTMHNDELHRRTIDGLLLKCLDYDQSRLAMGEVHEGICGTHQSAHKMCWLIKRAGFYWSTLLEDCFRYYKGCEACQQFGNIQLAPAAMLNPIIKPWPFRGWGLDFIGEIHP